MGQLVAYYTLNELPLRNRVEVLQLPMTSAGGAVSSDGAIRPSLVYVRTPTSVGSMLVPFGAYDEWSLRDRYNEALRIMTWLGASSITCETYREVARAGGIRARFADRRGSVSQQRIENSGFDYRHDGEGNRTPRDPRPLRWPDEPGFTAAVENVIDNGVTEITINIRNNRHYSVDGSLGLQLKGIGFELGGNSENSGATSLHIRATFPRHGRSWRG